MKKILSLMMAVLMVVLAGCNNASGVTTVPATQPSKPVVTTPVATTPVPTEPTTAEPEDELEILCVSEGYASANDGVYLKRDGKLYVVGSIYVPAMKGVNYTNGLVRNNRVQLYEAQFPLSPPFGGLDGALSYGDVPVPIIEKDDLVVGFFSAEPFIVSMRKVVFCGYSVPVLFSGSDGGVWNEGVCEIKSVVSGDPAKLTFEDKNGKKPDSPRNLVYGDIYTVSWFAGTQYNELKMVANCSYYVYPDYEDVIVLNGTLTKNGYCTFDLSSLLPGLYKVDGGGIIEIK